MLKEILEGLGAERNALYERLQEIIEGAGISAVAEEFVSGLSEKEAKEVAELIVQEADDFENDFPDLYKLFEKHKYKKFIEDYYYDYAEEIDGGQYFVETIFNALSNDQLIVHIEFMENNF